MSTDPRSQFLHQMALAGLAPVKPLDLVEGKVVSFRGECDKGRRPSCWAIFFGGATPAGAFGSHRGDMRHTWRMDATPDETPQQRAARMRHMQVLAQQRQADLARVHAAARERANQLHASSRPATSAHPYLRAKGVPAYGIRQLGQQLLVPMRDAQGVLHSLQFISPGGDKRFLTGGRVQGCYFGIGRPERELLIGEGLATCSTLRQATGSAVAVCFTCGNLEPVARALRAKFPRLRLVLCADNDAATPGNPGVTHATAAAKAVGGFLAVPRFEGTPR